MNAYGEEIGLKPQRFLTSQWSRQKLLTLIYMTASGRNSCSALPTCILSCVIHHKVTERVRILKILEFHPLCFCHLVLFWFGFGVGGDFLFPKPMGLSDMICVEGAINNKSASTEWTFDF